MNLNKRISIYNKNLSMLEKDLLNKLLDNVDKFSYKTFTIENIAKEFSVSTSTVHRLSKKLHYKSFVQFKDDYFGKSDITKDEKELLGNSYIDSIMETYKVITETMQEEIVDKMANCKKITIYSMGINKYIASIFETKLQLLGIPTEQHNDPRFMRLSSKLLKRNDDLVFILSKSGETPELLEVLVDANLKCIDVVLITESRESTFERLCKYVIYAGESKCIDDDIDTKLNMHIAVDFIVKRFIKKYKVKRDNYL